MSAPDYETLQDVENPFEDACKLIWAGRSEVPSFTQRECDDLPAERVDFQLVIVGSIGARENAWRAQLVAKAWSRRDADGRSKSGALRGLLRDCFRRAPVDGTGHEEFTEERLPYHVVNMLTHTGSTPESDIGDDLDACALRWDVVISVRPGAFPVADPEP